MDEGVVVELRVGRVSTDHVKSTRSTGCIIVLECILLENQPPRRREINSTTSDSGVGVEAAVVERENATSAVANATSAVASAVGVDVTAAERDSAGSYTDATSGASSVGVDLAELERDASA